MGPKGSCCWPGVRMRGDKAAVSVLSPLRNTPIFLGSQRLDTPMDTRGLTPLLAWLREAPPGTTVLAAEIVERLANVAPNGAGVSSDGPTPTWRERLWTVPPETRMGRQELLEALGRSENWLYRHTKEEGDVCPDPMPEARR